MKNYVFSKIGKDFVMEMSLENIENLNDDDAVVVKGYSLKKLIKDAEKRSFDRTMDTVERNNRSGGTTYRTY